MVVPGAGPSPAEGGPAIAGGTVIIQDMDAEASPAAIGNEVAGMGLNRVNSWVTGRVLRRLRRRAYSRAQMESLVSQCAFRTGTVTTGGISLVIRLAKP